MTPDRLAARLRRRTASDPLLRDIRDAARRLGLRVWLVGGAVRDAALGRPASDLDLAADGAKHLARALASAWGHRGFRFEKRGVTTYRFAVAGREVDIVDAAARGIRGDLLRRDFTMNAVAFDLAQGVVLDPLGGLRDIGAGRLRLPRPGVVREDPVRALRACRFLAELPEFRLDPAAKREVARAARALRRASVERIAEELDKLLATPRPDRGLDAVERLGLLPSVLPELASLRGCVAGEGRPSVWRHTLDALALAARPRRAPGSAAARDPRAARLLRWTLLVHDVSKPETLSRREDGRPAFHGHELAGARRAEALLHRLKLPKTFRRRVSQLVRCHLRPHHLADAGPTERGLKRLVRDAGEDLPVLVLHAACDALASGSPDARARWRRLRPVLLQLLALHETAAREPLPVLVTGTDVMFVLGVGPGPDVGQALREIREMQEDGAITSREQALDHLAALGGRVAPVSAGRPKQRGSGAPRTSRA